MNIIHMIKQLLTMTIILFVVSNFLLLIFVIYPPVTSKTHLNFYLIVIFVLVAISAMLIGVGIHLIGNLRRMSRQAADQ